MTYHAGQAQQITLFKRVFLVLLVSSMWWMPSLTAVELPQPRDLIPEMVPDFPRFNPIPPGLPFKKAVKIEVRTKPENEWDVMIKSNIGVAVRKNELFAIELWGRAQWPSDSAISLALVV